MKSRANQRLSPLNQMGMNPKARPELFFPETFRGRQRRINNYHPRPFGERVFPIAIGGRKLDSEGELN